MNETEVDKILSAIAELGARLRAVEMDSATTRQLVEKQPDMRLLGHQIVALIDRVSALEEKNVRALAAINDFARDNLTPGEVEALHSALTEVRQADFNIDVRLRRVEAELHLDS
jgi:formyltetrahydrofolate synthetase